MPPKRAPNHLRDFVKMGQEIEGVVQHVGRETWDLVLIDVNGRWVRDEFPTQDAAEAACRELGVRVHLGWDDPRMVRRMNARDHWNRPGGQRRAL